MYILVWANPFCGVGAQLSYGESADAGSCTVVVHVFVQRAWEEGRRPASQDDDEKATKMIGIGFRFVSVYLSFSGWKLAFATERDTDNWKVFQELRSSFVQRPSDNDER